MNSSISVDLLQENLTVRQREDEGFRRWFVNSYFELIVWYKSKGGELYGFQLCLSRNRSERAFTWTTDYTSSHQVSESIMETGFSHQSTGILQGDGKAISEQEIERFRREGSSLESGLKNLVIEKILADNLRRASRT